MADNWLLKAVLSARDNMSPVLKGVAKTAKTTRKYLLDVGNSAANLAGQIGMPLGLIAGATSALSLASLRTAVLNFSELTGNISDSARGVGMTTDEYQRMTYIAGQSGIAADAMGASMAKLNKNIADAAAGKNKELAALFAKSGIALRGANGQLRSATDLLPEVADLFKRNQNAAIQARMGNAIYGKSWKDLAPLLNDGSEGIDKLAQRYKMLGIAISSDSVAAGEAFGDQLDDLRAVAASYGNTISAKLLPVLSPLIEKTIEWAVQNRDLIATNVAKHVTAFAESLASVDWSGVIGGIESFIGGVRSFVEWVGGAKNALIMLAVVMNAQAIMATFALLGSIWRLVFGLGILTFKTIPAAIAGMGGLGGAMSAASAKASGLLGTLGKIGAVGGAAFAGWEIGSWLNENVVNPGMEKLTGEKGQTLGGWVFDKLNPDDAGGQQSLVAPASRAKVDGKVQIELLGLPQGARVQQSSDGGNLPWDLSMGFSSNAMGMP